MLKKERDLILEMIDSRYIPIDFDNVPEMLVAYSLFNQKLTELKISIKTICNILLTDND